MSKVKQLERERSLLRWRLARTTLFPKEARTPLILEAVSDYLRWSKLIYYTNENGTIKSTELSRLFLKNVLKKL